MPAEGNLKGWRKMRRAHGHECVIVCRERPPRDHSTASNPLDSTCERTACLCVACLRRGCDRQAAIGRKGRAQAELDFLNGLLAQSTGRSNSSPRQEAIRNLLVLRFYCRILAPVLNRACGA